MSVKTIKSKLTGITINPNEIFAVQTAKVDSTEDAYQCVIFLKEGRNVAVYHGPSENEALACEKEVFSILEWNVREV